MTHLTSQGNPATKSALDKKAQEATEELRELVRKCHHILIVQRGQNKANGMNHYDVFAVCQERHGYKDVLRSYRLNLVIGAANYFKPGGPMDYLLCDGKHDIVHWISNTLGFDLRDTTIRVLAV